MSNPAIVFDRSAAVLYIGASDRRDCCGGCSFSRVVTYEASGGAESLRCDLLRRGVGKGAICSEWQPVRVVLDVAASGLNGRRLADQSVACGAVA